MDEQSTSTWRNLARNETLKLALEIEKGFTASVRFQKKILLQNKKVLSFALPKVKQDDSNIYLCKKSKSFVSFTKNVPIFLHL